ncbi:inositol-trisphosphate 3-kinase B [Chelonus insularis]|uniref:inositol-trisphosphate 3-kinase B n=1 Tax=Chelonus insularis TaxID=460826 RepID=UPI00158A53E5|nr:inositol-trisphosphate 3-kinase B [Chelonus insularis]XP_034938878.1 inositol-trisphosphate 3-kinase B [Chelonus insularis]
MKSKTTSKSQNDIGDLDPSEANERYDEFNAIMMPVSRTLNKSPQSDEGIEPDNESVKAINRSWSLDSSANGDDEGVRSGLWQRRRSRFKVTRCCSSDSAVISDDDQTKGWDNLILEDKSECDSIEDKPRYWRTPSVVVSDYSDYSYLEEKFERCDLDIEKYDGTSGSPSQASSCSCLDCDEIRDFHDLSSVVENHRLQVCGQRRHSDSCCACLSSNNTINSGISNNQSRRNSCLTTSSSYSFKLDSHGLKCSKFDASEETKTTVELLDIPPIRKISDCSTNSSLSGDDFEVTELQPLRRPQSSGWRKLRNIVQWTPFFQTYKKQRYPWVQLAGHQGNFRAGPTPGTILKKLCPQEEACFRLLMHDVLRPYVPEFKGVLEVREPEEEHNQEVENANKDCDEPEKVPVITSYLQLQDLLGDFEQPCVMDCKVGVRTYLESELAKAKERPKLRKDMYEKMIQVDPSAPSLEEKKVQGVTKPRYMVWRETISSTASLGFRVEGIKLSHGVTSKDFKTTRTREQVTEALKRFVENYPHAVPKYLQRLKAIRATLKTSPFFATHEIVGSSLLFVHDANNAGVWMIDFAKTLPLPSHLPRIKHDAEWQVGNHEDGYLIGVNNLIDIFEDIRNSQS